MNSNADIISCAILDVGEQENTHVMPQDFRRGSTYKISGNFESLGERVKDFSDRFQFICWFNAGGVGQICKARDILFDRIVAVKTLNDKYHQNPHSVKAFLEECRLNAQLDHPSIVPIYSLGRMSGKWVVAMKLIDGMSLAGYIRQKRGQYPIPKDSERKSLYERLEYFLKVCEVIEYCHSREIVHGDLKPENIMIGKFGEVYVMDWGCARQSGSILKHISGTPDYIPPEFCRDKHVTVLIDVYALGVILYEMLTLRRCRDNRRAGSPPCLCCFKESPGVSPELQAIVHKAADPDPDRRYRSVLELAQDVRNCVYQEEVSAYPDNLLRRITRTVNNHRVASILTLASVFVAFAISLSWLLYQNKVMEQRVTLHTMEVVKLQALTDDLAERVGRNVLLAQAQVTLFADNLIELTRFYSSDDPQTFYNNSDYASAETSPPEMFKVAGYVFPVTLDHIVRYPSDTPPARKLIDVRQFIYLCRKVIGAQFDGDSVMPNAPDRILSADCMIQYLFARWENDEVYSYPGTYRDPKSKGFRERWRYFPGESWERKIHWSHPFRGKSGTHRIICRYPMYTHDGVFMGVAGLELRLEQVLAPLIEASVSIPDNRFYVVDNPRRLTALIDDRIITLPDENGVYPAGLSAREVLNIGDRMKKDNFKPFEMKIQNERYLVCGAPFKIIDGVFIHMTKLNKCRL